MKILIAAAENGALPGGKVGGIGDVVRDLPAALAGLGHDVTVVIPAYGRYAGLPAAQKLRELSVSFAGVAETVGVYSVPAESSAVRQLVLDHPHFAVHGAGRIYHDDGAERPFASDAHKFAFFSAGVAALLLIEDDLPDAVHLHDWHLGMLLALRAFEPSLAALRGLPFVYSIHNLAYQGIRPFTGDASSFEAWFPELQYDRVVLGDPRYDDCVNPMATAIRLADRVATVSPGYADEIVRPSDPARGFVGGEGLEKDLQAARAAGRLHGILNGCAYPEKTAAPAGWRHLLDAIGQSSLTISRPLPSRRPRHLLTSVGRVAGQKVALMLERADGEPSALERLLQRLERGSLLLLLGSGEADYEQQLAELASHYGNFIFLNGYSDAVAGLLYDTGNLFLMPSSFEPCGISQLLAMRAGQPCVVHGVGGLSDTVEDGVTGFVFHGDSIRQQGEQFVETTCQALALRKNDEDRWQAVCQAAAAQRFTWEASARAHLDELYQ